mmetsp:Transcript_24176/g.29307  ORF Transcript_24176/g.29307 Transcript_24176/m.29307 type:complete len:538 (-) Transcript_24176:136-1749(-)|eukprot:CAMPEP_0197852014 /NCGR_PEP_ID=MMETSP1438-20131217/19465_1 /TAXON_ID=1461541 /ORGANISM="Pterosperma sp., Strain CCMP1384" /LENGTH=537 /DNA_ID=CAMNT_0043465851 /DNA_START=153 /DNA_END=1766 /DNA_ORIENTATION=-
MDPRGAAEEVGESGASAPHELLVVPQQRASRAMQTEAMLPMQSRVFSSEVRRGLQYPEGDIRTKVRLNLGLLGKSSPASQEFGAAALLELSKDSNRQYIVQQDGIPLLLAVMSEGSRKAQKIAFEVLVNLSYQSNVSSILNAITDQFKMCPVPSTGAISLLRFYMNQRTNRADAVTCLWNASFAFSKGFQSTHSVQSMLIVIPTLVKILSEDPGKPASETKTRAAGTLRNFTYSSKYLQKVLADNDAIPHLVQLLRDGPSQVKAHAVDTLRNLSLCSDDLSRLVTDSGAGPLMVQALSDCSEDPEMNNDNDDNGQEEFNVRAAAALHILLSSDSESLQKFVFTYPDLVPTMSKWCVSRTKSNEAVIEGVALALRELSAARSVDIRRSMAQAGLVPSLVKLLQDGNQRVQAHAAEVLVNLINVPKDASNEQEEGATLLSDVEKWSCLVGAVKGGHTELALLLIASGGLNIDALDCNEGLSPLMIAARASHKGMVEMLLAAGAVCDVVDKDGCTALEFAKRSGNTDVVKLLLESGGNEQ